jgi:hypothetical protein
VAAGAPAAGSLSMAVMRTTAALAPKPLTVAELSAMDVAYELRPHPAEDTLVPQLLPGLPPQMFLRSAAWITGGLVKRYAALRINEASAALGRGKIVADDGSELLLFVGTPGVEHGTAAALPDGATLAMAYVYCWGPERRQPLVLQFARAGNAAVQVPAVTITGVGLARGGGGRALPAHGEYGKGPAMSSPPPSGVARGGLGGGASAMELD